MSFDSRRQVAGYLRIPEQTLRFNEGKGLLPPFSPEISDAYVRKARVLRAVRGAGVSMGDVKEVFGVTEEEYLARAAAVGVADGLSQVGLFVPITKRDDDERMVYGYASTPSMDSQGDSIPVETIQAALPGNLKFGNIREMHQPSAVGYARE